MNIYWSLKSIPELRDLSPTQRTVAWFVCVHNTFRHWQTWTWCIVSIGLCITSAILLVRSLVAGSSLLILALATTIAFGHRQSVIIRPYLKKYLEKRNAEHHASPNGGPAEPLGNSGAGGGPPSVS